MKRVVLNYLAVTVTIVFTFFSCEMNDDMSSGYVKLLDTISDEVGGYGKYEYDKQNRISKYSYYIPNRYGNSTLTQSLMFSYKGSDLVKIAIGQDSHSTSFYEFKKSGNIVTIRTSTGSNDEYAFTSTLNLNDDGLPVRCEDILSKDGSAYRVSTYQYENGNPVKIAVEGADYNGKEYSSNAIYTYDNQKSPFYDCKTPKWFMIWYLREMGSPNNLVEVTQYSSNYVTDVASEWGETTSTIKYEYVFDSDGFPTKCTVTDFNKRVIKETEFKYND